MPNVVLFQDVTLTKNAIKLMENVVLTLNAIKLAEDAIKWLLQNEITLQRKI